MKITTIALIIMFANNIFAQNKFPDHVLEYLKNTPLVWVNGNNIKEYALIPSTGELVMEIESGCCFDRLEEIKIEAYLKVIIFPIKDIVLREYNAYFWAENGLIKHSLMEIKKSHNKQLLLWRINVLVVNEEIIDVDYIDLRGRHAKTYFKKWGGI